MYVKYLVVILTLYSCATKKWQQAYMIQQLQKLEQYKVENSLSLDIPTTFPSPKHKGSKLKRKEVKLFFKHVELAIATRPDSVAPNNNNIDSFYFLESKIRFISNHNLDTKNKHLIH